MRALLELWPNEMLDFLRKNLLFGFFSQIILFILYLVYLLYIPNFFILNLNVDTLPSLWIFVRIFLTLFIFPIRIKIYRYLSSFRVIEEREELSNSLIELTDSYFWRFNAGCGIFVYLWIGLSFILQLYYSGEFWHGLNQIHIIHGLLFISHIFLMSRWLRHLTLQDIPTWDLDNNVASPLRLHLYSTIHTYTEEDSENDSCGICFSNFIIDDRIRELTCKHRFHLSCIDAWLTGYKRLCPYCHHPADEPFKYI